MNKVWLVTRREYLENVKSKLFLFSLALMPMAIGLMIVVSTLFIKRSAPREATVAILDGSGQLFAALEEQAARHNARPEARPRWRLEEAKLEGRTWDEAESDLARRARSREILGYLAIQPDVLDGKGGALYASSNLALQEAPESLGRWLNAAVMEARLRRQNLDPHLAEAIRRPVAFEIEALGRKSGEGKGKGVEAVVAPLFASMAMVMLLFMGAILVGQACLNSVIDEKSSRIVEVVLASVSPHQFMVGKILGMGLMGLTLLATWVASAYGAAAWKGYAKYVPLEMLGYLLVFFVLGFLLCAATFCAVGSMCNSLKEAQNLMGPLSLLFAVPLVLLTPIARDPSGLLARIMSFVPFWTPFVMMSRLAGSPRPSHWEALLSIAVLAAGTAAVFWVAGRIFRVGILMYGQPARLREVFRWIRQI